MEVAFVEYDREARIKAASAEREELPKVPRELLLASLTEKCGRGVERLSTRVVDAMLFREHVLATCQRVKLKG